ncbi:MAG TPA: DUF2516 family protein [Thermomonospora sp.]|nr:DUF2516 family protein [Thermomonospora sp.]
MNQGLDTFFWILAIAAFAFEVWALVDAVRVPAGAYTAADKQTKKLWVILLVVATVVGLGGAGRVLHLLTILPIAAFLVAAIYMADVKPAVAHYRGRGRGDNRNMGPYGPW